MATAEEAVAAEVMAAALLGVTMVAVLVVAVLVAAALVVAVMAAAGAPRNTSCHRQEGHGMGWAASLLQLGQRNSRST